LGDFGAELRLGNRRRRAGYRDGRQKNERQLQRSQPVDNSPKRGVFFALFDQSLPLKRSQNTRPPVAALFRNEMSGVLNKNGMTRRNYPAS
jgi:hypothetical protein